MLRLRLPAGTGELPQPLLPGAVGGVHPVLCARRAWMVRGRPARATAGAGDGPPLVDMGATASVRLVLIYAALVKINPDWLRGEPLGLWFAEHTVCRLSGLAPATRDKRRGRLGPPPAALSGSAPAAAPPISFSGVHSLRRISSGQLHPVSYRPLSLADAGGHADVLRSRLAETGVVATRWEQAGRTAASPVGSGVPRPGLLTCACLVAFFAFQILVPCASGYPGNVAWTGEGEWFAWRMKLDAKRAHARFIVSDPASERRWEVDPSDHLRTRQVQIMATRPDMIIQFARHLETVWVNREGVANVDVRAVVMCSLNGRPAAQLIDPDTDLTKVPRTLRHQTWILPLTTPLEVASPTTLIALLFLFCVLRPLLCIPVPPSLSMTRMNAARTGGGIRDAAPRTDFHRISLSSLLGRQCRPLRSSWPSTGSAPGDRPVVLLVEPDTRRETP